MMAIETVIFDIGNVLVEWHPARPFDRLIGPDRRKALFARVDFEGMNHRSDLGAESMEDGVARLMAEHPEHAEDIAIWRDHWMEMLAPDLPLSAQLLRGLRARGVPVHALSNFGDATFDLAERTYPVLTEFDERFISARLGMMKPDPAIYAHVETVLGGDPARYLFIDDRPENIEAAQARGWQGHLFTSPQGLAERLVAEALLDAEAALP